MDPDAGLRRRRRSRPRPRPRDLRPVRGRPQRRGPGSLHACGRAATPRRPNRARPRSGRARRGVRGTNHRPKGPERPPIGVAAGHRPPSRCHAGHRRRVADRAWSQGAGARAFYRRRRGCPGLLRRGRRRRPAVPVGGLVAVTPRSDGVRAARGRQRGPAWRMRCRATPVLWCPWASPSRSRRRSSPASTSPSGPVRRVGWPPGRRHPRLAGLARLSRPRARAQHPVVDPASDQPGGARSRGAEPGAGPRPPGSRDRGRRRCHLVVPHPWSAARLLRLATARPAGRGSVGPPTTARRRTASPDSPRPS
jgi:hypothetical protein